MILGDIIKELESLARQSDDAALVNETVGALMHPQSDAALDGPNQDATRVSELRGYALDYPRQAEQLRKEGALFREIIAWMEFASARLKTSDLDDFWVSQIKTFFPGENPTITTTYHVIAYDEGGYGDNRSRDFDNEQDAVDYAREQPANFGAQVFKSIVLNPMRVSIPISIK